MTKAVMIEDLDDTAEKILDAASSRFLHYGYGKTTMSEIARDCNMSTGNLYRYFPAKMDIAESFVRRLRTDHMAKLRKVVTKNSKEPAVEKLRRFLHLKFKLAYERFHDRPKAYELSSEIMRERKDFASEWEAAENALIAEILDIGEKSGEFRIKNKHRMARIIQDAVYRFTSPAVFHEGEFDDLLSELDDIICVLLDAFAWRRNSKGD